MCTRKPRANSRSKLFRVIHIQRERARRGNRAGEKREETRRSHFVKDTKRQREKARNEDGVSREAGVTKPLSPKCTWFLTTRQPLDSYTSPPPFEATKEVGTGVAAAESPRKVAPERTAASRSRGGNRRCGEGARMKKYRWPRTLRTHGRNDA